MYLGQQFKILVVDDNELTRAVLRSIINGEEKYLVVGEATNGESGLELARKLRPDIICLDVIMPKIGGLEILQQVKEEMPDVTVLMVTASEDAETLNTAKERGASGFIKKPLNPGKVLDTINSAVAHLRPKEDPVQAAAMASDAAAVRWEKPGGHVEPLRSGTHATSTYGRTLLLVDDEPFVLSALMRDLRTLGFQILIAPNADTALEILDSNEIGVILSDQQMQGLTGAELLGQVRRKHPATVRIILSAFADVNTVKDAITTGAIYKFIIKPWDRNDLSNVLLSAFAKYEKEKSALAVR